LSLLLCCFFVTLLATGGEATGRTLSAADIMARIELTDDERAWLAGRPKVRIRFGQPFQLSVSIGASEIRADDSIDALVGRVDSALYRAKDAGRSQVVVAWQD